MIDCYSRIVVRLATLGNPLEFPEASWALSRVVMGNSVFLSSPRRGTPDEVGNLGFFSSCGGKLGVALMC